MCRTKQANIRRNTSKKNTETPDRKAFQTLIKQYSMKSTVPNKTEPSIWNFYFTYVFRTHLSTDGDISEEVYEVIHIHIHRLKYV